MVNLKNILRNQLLTEYYEEEEAEKLPLGIKEKIWRKFDTVGVPAVMYSLWDTMESEETQADLIKTYLTDYNDRKPHYIKIEWDGDDIASNVASNDYGLEKIVAGMIDGDWSVTDDMYYYECYFDSYQLDYIDKTNWETIKELMLAAIEGSYYEYDEDKTEEENLIEFAKEELKSEIGCSYTEAQADADLAALHDDLIEVIEDYLSNFNGKINWETNRYEGEVEIGELVDSGFFDMSLEEEVDQWEFYNRPEEGNTSFWRGLLDKIIENENDGWGKDAHFISDDKISVNTDKHFRYGGAGNVSNEFVNEILINRLANHE